MKKLALLIALSMCIPTFSQASVEIDGETFEVVDMHLHTGKFGDFTQSGKSFIMSQLPRFTVMSFPGVSAMTSNPWAPHIGIQAQTEWAGVDHGEEKLISRPRAFQVPRIMRLYPRAVSASPSAAFIWA